MHYWIIRKVSRDGSKNKNREESEMRWKLFKARSCRGATEFKIFFNCCMLELNCAVDSFCFFRLDDCFCFLEKLIFLDSLFKFQVVLLDGI